MTTRRFGPVRGAGTAIVQKESQKKIAPGALGTAAFSGILQKGPIGKIFAVLNPTNMLFKGGNYVAQSQVPDCVFDYYNLGGGAGNIWLNRLTDGDEKVASLIMNNRKPTRASALRLDAGNAGRWGGKKQIKVDEYASVTANTVTLTDIPAALKIDEYEDALVSFSAIPGKSYKVISNTELGVITFASDVDLITDLGGSGDKLLAVNLANSGLSIGVLLKDGTSNPTTEWAADVYFIEGGAFTRVKAYDNMSSDPNATNYYLKIINDDSNADYLIKATDLHVGLDDVDVRPANVHSVSLTLTDTVLTSQIHDAISSAVSLATARIDSLTPGASVIEDVVTLTCAAAGVRAAESLTFPGVPDDDDTTVINGMIITFKIVVTDPLVEVLIAGSAELTIDNLVTFINASVDVLLLDIVFAEKQTSAIMDLFAQNAGVAGNAITTTSGGTGNEPTWGAGVLSTGVDQTWDYVSTNMPFVTGSVVTTGVVFAAPNVYGAGFTIQDTTKDSSKMFAVADTIVIDVRPLEVGGLVGGLLIPNTVERRIKFAITANTANTITVKTGSLMLADAAFGDDFMVEYVQQLGGGHNGIASIADQDYVNGYDGSTSPLKGLRGKNLGFIKLATPGITATAVQKAGVAFGELNNWGYRYEIPASVTDEQAAEEYVNDTIGRNDYAVVQWPSYAYVLDPVNDGLKLTTQTGAIMGREAKFAKDFQGFHKASTDTTAILSNIVKLPEGMQDKVIDEEFTNPVGLNLIKQVDGNFILWGDRSLSIDTAFKFKHHREQLSYYENVFIENYDFIIFAINDPETQNILIASFIAFFKPEFDKRAIRGTDLLDAVLIKLDEENNTDATRGDGDLHATIEPRLADTVERFIITIGKKGITEL